MNELLPFIPGQLTDMLNSLPYFVPELYLAGLFLIVLITDLLFRDNSAWMCRIIAAFGLLVVLLKVAAQIPVTHSESRIIFGNMLLLSRTAVSFKLIIDFFAIILILYFGLDKRLQRHPKGLSDLYTIVVASVLGLHLMTMAFNLLMVFLAIEMVSLASYLLAAYRSENGFSAEAGLKYVLFGAVASAVMLYGISLLYTQTSTLGFWDQNYVSGLSVANPTVVGLALILTLAGLGFKLSFVPMHFWVPDVYEGAPTPVTAYLSTLPKIAAFALLINFLTPFLAYPQWHSFDFRLVLCVVGVVSMIVGNFAAVWQKNIKRMLAYSSIGHTGFALMAVATFTSQGVSSLTFYLAAYSFANIAALMLASYFSDAANADDLESYRGLGLKHVLPGVCFVIVLISLTGLPVSVGFNGKLLVFSAVYTVYQQTHDVWMLILLITGAVTTVVSLFYYIKVPLYLFLKKRENHDLGFASNVSSGLKQIFVLLTILALLFGIFPQFLAYLL